MTALSSRLLELRRTWQPNVMPADCDHDARAFYGEVGDGVVVRRCSVCGFALADPEPRCVVILAARRGTRGRRCLSPVRYGDRCRAHR